MESGAPSVLVVMGVSGAGKSTVAAALAGHLGWDLAEGDDFHPPANLRKMAAGHPLDDADRAPWLQAIAGWIQEQTAAGRQGIVTCSALRRRYRDVLRMPEVVFVLLSPPDDVVANRLAARRGHFMPAALLASQLEALEPPTPEERALTITATGNPQAVAHTVVERLGLPATRRVV